MPISIKFPFKNTNEGGVFKSTKTEIEVVQTNLISLLTTKRRNRVMRNNFYSPIWDYIFEPWDDQSEDSLRSELSSKIYEFIEGIEVTNVSFDFDRSKSKLEINIAYRIIDLGDVVDNINLVFPVNNV